MVAGKMVIFVLNLPVSCIIWYFRDEREDIERKEKQINDNTNKAIIVNKTMSRKFIIRQGKNVPQKAKKIL